MTKNTNDSLDELIIKNSFSISVQPNPVGFWVLYPGVASQTRFAMYKRPTNEQIKNTEALLGWGWEEK